MKSIFDKLGGTYHSEGDYLIPDIVGPEAPRIGVWGRKRKHYLQHPYVKRRTNKALQKQKSQVTVFDNPGFQFLSRQ